MAGASPQPDDITRLFKRSCDGDEEARNRFADLTFPELRRIAHALMRKERPDHTLQATALVGEFYVRLFQGAPLSLQDRGHFYRFAAKKMRHILIDHAKRHNAQRHGGGLKRVELDGLPALSDQSRAEIIDLERVLTRLESVNPGWAEVVDYHLFLEMTHQETAGILGVSDKTVKRRWDAAYLWINKELQAPQKTDDA